jgi:hypothetical protein
MICRCFSPEGKRISFSLFPPEISNNAAHHIKAEKLRHAEN